MRSAVIGLRLCGIALEPFWPGAERLLDLAHLGALEVADLGRERSSAGAGERDRVAAARRGGRAATTWVATGSAASPSRSQHAAPRRRGSTSSTCRPRPRACRPRPASNARSQPLAVAVRPRSAKPASFEPERRRLGVDAVGAADHSVSRVLARPLGERRGAARAPPSTIDRARVAQLQRERGVDDVGRGEAVVDPAPRRARRRAPTHVDERGDVVVGDLLALVDRLDGERRARARIAAASAAGSTPSSAQASAAGELDLEPGVELAPRRSRWPAISGRV